MPTTTTTTTRTRCTCKAAHHPQGCTFSNARTRREPLLRVCTRCNRVAANGSHCTRCSGLLRVVR